MKEKSISPLLALILLVLLLAGCQGTAPAGDGCAAGTVHRGSNTRCGPQAAVAVLPAVNTADEAPVETDVPAAGLPNPAAVYCQEQGYVYQIETAVDGSQAGVCIFDERGARCDGWAYFRGECDPAAAEEEVVAGNVEGGEPVEGWAGTLIANPPGAQFDDVFLRADGAGYYGIDSVDPVLRAQLQSLRDSGATLRVWGILRRDVPDAYGMQIEVQRLAVEAPVEQGTE